VAITAIIVSVTAFVYYYTHGVTLAYDDAVSHMIIARRVLTSPTPGLAQLGSVWLPLPHLLMAPLIWNNYLFYSGVAGSLPSMAAFVGAAILIYRTGCLLTGRATGGLVAAVAFMANPNVIYMQSTPMTETLLFAFIAGAVYGLSRWIVTDRWEDLGCTGISLLGATLTRYEGWVTFAAVTAVVALVARVRRYDRARTEASLIFFGLIGTVGIIGWLLWNQVIFGSALDFQTGKYAKSSLWVGDADKAVGHLGTALRTYSDAVTQTVGLPMLAAACIGLVVFFLARPGPLILAPLTPVALFPFFVYALYSGQRPLHVRPLDTDLYNVRFGLLMAVPAALFAGCAVGLLPRPLVPRPAGAGPTVARTLARAGRSAVVATALALVMIAASVTTAVSGRIVTLEEPRTFSRGHIGSERVVVWLRDHYTGGRILMQGFGNEYVLFHSHLPLSEEVYEGSYRLWTPSLRDPAGEHINWIYMTRLGNDQVYEALHNSPRLKASYIRVFSDGTHEIYRRAL
jgi:hypothetical protein